MRKYTTLMITTALALMFVLGCSSSSNTKRTTTAKPTEKVTVTTTKTAEARKKSTSSSTFLGYSTKSDYKVIVGSAHKNPEIIQLLKRLERQCRCADDLVSQHIKPTENNTFHLALSPGMPWIAFQVVVDDGAGGRVYLNDQDDWPSIKVYDATVNFEREVGVTRSGSFRGKGHGLFMIREEIE